MKVKIDLSKDGLAMLYKPYEIVAWAVVRASPGPVGSGHVWAETNEGLKKLYGARALYSAGASISRASVIFFLNREVDKGFMGWNDATGKGGHHRLYYPKYSERQILQIIKEKVCEKLSHAMGDY